MKNVGVRASELSEGDSQIIIIIYNPVSMFLSSILEIFKVSRWKRTCFQIQIDDESGYMLCFHFFFVLLFLELLKMKRFHDDFIYYLARYHHII